MTSVRHGVREVGTAVARVRCAAIAVAFAACGASEAAPEPRHAAHLAAITNALCATHGHATVGARVNDPTLHASCVAPIPGPMGSILPPGCPTVLIG